jgi:hypothetical protein
VRLTVLEPIPTSGLTREAARELAERVRQIVVSAGAGLRDESEPAH